MLTLVDGFREMVHLIGDTFRLWWRNLLPLATWFLAGYVGFRASINGAIWLSQHQHKSLAFGLFSAGLLIQIAASVGMIRTCATSLYRWRAAAEDQSEETSDPTQQNLMELLSVTLLPLVAVWSAWGFLEQAISELSVSTLVQLGTGPGTQFFEIGGDAWRGYLPAIVILLVLRRVVEAIDDRWPSRPAKFVQVWAEAFFLLLTVLVVPRAIDQLKGWLEVRNFWVVTVDWWGDVKDFFEGINVPVPAGLEFLWGFFWETLWPLFKEGVGEPLTWLAITTVVFGHRVLSGSSVLRGTRLERRLGGEVVVQPPQNRIVALTNKAPNLVLGGLREKFYPTLNAFRLLVRVGPVFLGVVCLVYTFWTLGDNWSQYSVMHLIGVHGERWGLMNYEIADLVASIIFETLRIALLAAAFDLCISVGAQRRAEAAASTGIPEGEPVRS
ncbi:hypothetical protein Kfla_0006 [Kribbella flavida DSM 17836]|uniref:Uncharacterized protein n=1 Tax=Kribbella flavida (strain DSM 17836 / JCM 10339 / NBRC 14399) TaxID=479435 RepID=D2PQF0_KRIFD|nr:hypothetical protein [Kribbella flavida]ADB29137.1 hypothetical protein Kfla_0006 [Kribbella flavida DSM 17836]